MKKNFVNSLILCCLICFSCCWTQDSQGQNTNQKVKTIVSLKSDTSPELKTMTVSLIKEETISQKRSEVVNITQKVSRQIKTVPLDQTDPVAQTRPGQKDGPEPWLNFAGIKDISSASPSDANGDVGLNHYIQSVNSAFAIWDKSGNLLYGPVDNSTLWNDFEGPWAGTNDGDPVVVYDELADRWLISQFAIPDEDNGPFYELIAVSATNDPLGAWHRYVFEFENFNDYPKFGVWPNGYYSTYNMFPKANKEMTMNDYMGTTVVVFDREAMLAGSESANGIQFDNPELMFGQPADFDGTPPADSTNFLILGANPSFQLVVYQIATNWENPEESLMTLNKTLMPANFMFPPAGVPQPGHEYLIDFGISGRLMHRLQYRNFGGYETLLTNHAVMYENITAIRWYEIRRTDNEWSIYQQGTYAPDSLHRGIASIAMNKDGEIAMGYSVGGKNKWASVRYTGRFPNDPLGRMTLSEVESTTGKENSPYSNRWGDYSSLSVDPTDGQRFWYTSQFSGSNYWDTQITSFNISESPQLVIDAGDDAEICSTTRFNTQPTLENYQIVEWLSMGDGKFLWGDEPIAQYKPGNEDIANGEVKLVLTAKGLIVEGQIVTDTLNLRIVNCTGIETLALNSKVRLYPNPASNEVHIEIPNLGDEKVKIQIINIRGQVIFEELVEQHIGSYHKTIDFSNQIRGTYLIRTIRNKNVQIEKLILN